tara:strand:+ start:138 stop:365 length:228 start_codon:yes stop_codon:yes gene_type:complete
MDAWKSGSIPLTQQLIETYIETALPILKSMIQEKCKEYLHPESVQSRVQSQMDLKFKKLGPLTKTIAENHPEMPF